MTDVFISMNDKENDEKKILLKPYNVDSELMSKTNSNINIYIKYMDYKEFRDF